MKLLHEPLLQFFLIGMCIYGAYSIYGTLDEGFSDNTINLGVETGQVLFIAVVLSLMTLLKSIPMTAPQGSWRLSHFIRS